MLKGFKPSEFLREMRAIRGLLEEAVDELKNIREGLEKPVFSYSLEDCMTFTHGCSCAKEDDG